MAAAGDKDSGSEPGQRPEGKEGDRGEGGSTCRAWEGIAKGECPQICLHTSQHLPTLPGHSRSSVLTQQPQQSLWGRWYRLWRGT